MHINARKEQIYVKILVGIRSRMQVALEDFAPISVTSKAFAGIKHCNFDVQGVSKESRIEQCITCPS